MARDSSLHRHLLRDIDEMKNEPYTNVTFHVHGDLTKLCLILTPNGAVSLHFNMVLDGCLIHALIVIIQSNISHFNVLGSYIYASILDTQEGHIPAYTLESIAIQLLSVFSSDRFKQEHGGHAIDLSGHKAHYSSALGFSRRDACAFVDGPKPQCTHSLIDRTPPEISRISVGDARNVGRGNQESGVGHTESTTADGFDENDFRNEGPT